MSVRGQKIVLIVTGGIAAYKAADLTSRLKKAGAEVRVAMTAAARKFVAPLTFEAISGHPVYDRLFDDARSYEMEHISWSRWADRLVVAPATADFIAKMAHGIADDPALTLYLAADRPVWVAPAMNTKMWDHPATRANVATLASRGVHILPPGAGPLACGETGDGRMMEPAEIVAALEKDSPPTAEAATPSATSANGAGAKTGPLAGLSVLITAGPTREPLDPIRFISNRSTGRMGTALAARAAAQGATVYLIHGPLAAPIPEGVVSVPAEDSRAMLAAVQRHLPECRIAIFAAAVANYGAASAETKKIKGGDRLTLDLVRTTDIAAWAGANRPRPDQLLVGFAAESENLLEAARRKLENKRLDLIFANPIGVAGVGFEADHNIVTLISADGEELPSERMPKSDLAGWIWDRILERLKKTAPATAAPA